MSDFDKEAEREKLRKKYERDKRDREATQRMSDLLLKGATMTNAHCDTCADPLFRQNGVTFCPSCHGGPEAVEGPDLEEAGDAGGGSAAEERSATEAPAEDEEATATESGTETEAATPVADEDEPTEPPAPTEETGTETPTAPAEEGTNSSRRSDERLARHTTAPRRAPLSQQSSTRLEGRAGRDRRGRDQGGRRSSPPADADLETARASLTEALEHFSREAAETEDPRYARDCLEAAREAAETLAVLGR